MHRIICSLLMLACTMCAAARSPVIVILGDSLVAGYNVQREAALSNQLEMVLTSRGYPVSVINGGVSGDTSAGALTRLQWTLEQYHPDQVIVAIGGNDLLRGLPIEHTERNIRQIIEKLQKEQVKVILTSVVSLGYLDEQYSQAVNRLYPTLAQEYQVPLYPFLLLSLAELQNQPEVMQPDGIHPTAKGIHVIASDLAQFLIAKQFVAKEGA